MKKMFYLASLLIGGAAFAQITTNEINGIEVNMPLTELNAKFKQDIKPKVVENFTDEPENFTPVTINGTKYSIIFVKDFYSPDKTLVYSVATTDPKSKGKNLVGIGSTLAELKKAYAKESTDTTGDTFTVYQKDKGERILIFKLKNNKVTRIFASVFAAG
ncbi:hypothetical protein ELOC111193_05360 [Elizabethkingia occulta]|uniref:Beta-lactamase-inhibitor-like PepSY-like domain-containing protein n=1 Tax=Elizabethkingia occulta TaxID=1867263 RepID=A0A1T3MS89_9FLAO|nr:hypothetical protein [Elizabethkingia occulta]OPB87675.1 hypothetical protein BB020_03580 [Elizabethkingia occulta]OPC67488.1 hypothetical protein BAZ10_15635 [Elizabethkingia occulta]